jgi:hypothetical protein
MSDLLDVQINTYPELLRRMAAGEHLASQQDDTEKLAATLLAAEAIEAEQAAQAPIEKKAIDISTAIIGGLAIAPLKKFFAHLQGSPVVPEEGAELIQAFRKIMQGQQETEALKRKMLMVGLGAAGAGALAVKALEGKRHDKSSSDKLADHNVGDKKDDKDEKDEEKSDKKNLPPWLQGKGDKKDNGKSKSEKEEKDKDEKDSADVAVSNNGSGKVSVKTGSPSSRAVLDRLMKSFA